MVSDIERRAILGLDVLIIDYRGYGQSRGKPTEQGTYLDAKTVWDYLHDEIITFAMGQAIYAAVKQHKKFLELRGDHNNCFLISQRDYVAGLRDFTQTNLSP